MELDFDPQQRLEDLDQHPAALRAIFNRALALKRYEGENPVRAVKPIKESRGRVRFLDPGEEAALLATLPEPHRTLVLVGLHAGLRVKSEALSLTWSNVGTGDLRRCSRPALLDRCPSTD